MNESLVAMLVGAPFVAALVAIIRKCARRADGTSAVDGWVVPVVAGLLAIASAVLGYYAAAIPPIVWVVLGSVYTTILAVGGSQWAQDVAKKARPEEEEKP